VVIIKVSKAQLGKPSVMLLLHTSHCQPPETVQVGSACGISTARHTSKTLSCTHVLLCCLRGVSTGPSGAGESGNKYEAALYGALCGDVRAMLPACDSWEDEAWAYCR
jgi:hypothetical protein